MRTIRADEVATGDKIRGYPGTSETDNPIYRSVVGIRRGPTGDVLIDVEYGALIESIPPLEPNEQVTIE